MVFNDKVIKPSQTLAGRPLLPIGIIEFEAGDHHDSTFGIRLRWKSVYKGKGSTPIPAHTSDRDDVPDHEWVRLATVRISPDITLTPWRCPIPKKTWARRKTRVGASGRRYPPETRFERNERFHKEMLEEARKIRRQFTGSVQILKHELDTRLSGGTGNECHLESGSLQEVPAKGGAVTGSKRFLYKNPKVKGGIHLMIPSGEMSIQGNPEQQAFLLDLVRDFTTKWEGDVSISYQNLQMLDAEYRKKAIPKSSRGAKGRGAKGKGKGKGKGRINSFKRDAYRVRSDGVRGHRAMTVRGRSSEYSGASARHGVDAYSSHYRPNGPPPGLGFDG